MNRQELKRILQARQSQAQTAAERIGLAVKKSRAPKSMTNRNGFMLYDPRTNAVVKGAYYELTTDDVLRYVAEQEER